MVNSREARISELFVTLADTLIDDFDVVDFLHSLAEACIELLDVDAVGLMLANARGGLRLVASAPDRMMDLEVFELQTDEGPCLDTFTTGRPVVNVKIREAEDRWPAFTAAALAADLRSTHAIPLRLRGQLIGAMNLCSTKVQRLSEADLVLSQALADAATISLLQQRAITEQSLLAQQLQTALDTRILVEQAKGVLAERSGLSPNETFGYLRGYARTNRQSLSVVAVAVIEGSLSFDQLRTNSSANAISGRAVPAGRRRLSGGSGRPG